ncbi:MAG: TIGR00341 family protein [Gammaproteobacteria bacterium]|nr:TIGR00341 family protein [Gammaproteobacteria bacterium]MDE1886878.1 TIGR00341 family protein [Gammaproteobacteria bacterium]MDE2022664.1 TIGR00341 family protein [Gammaproteobacteria bacterium]
MKYVEVVANSGVSSTVSAIAEKFEAQDFRLGAVAKDGTQPMRLVVNDDALQGVLDALQNLLSTSTDTRVLVLPVEVSLPKPKGAEEQKKKDSATASREALYESVEKGARLDVNYLVLVMLSTIVAAIGIIENDIAVVIGAMVIAPLLAPNLALSLGTALGDTHLLRKATWTLLAGILLTLGLSVVIGALWPSPITSDALLSRTRVGVESVALALASGAAAVLSLTTGLSSVLVGVMVAVALLPPAAAFGLMLGQARFGLAIGAGLLLLVNIVCVNLAGNLVFFVKKVRPRTWLEKQKAKRAMLVWITGWLVMLIILVLIIYTRRWLAR